MAGRAAASELPPTVVAIDWSGARSPSAQRAHIWRCVVRDGDVVELAAGLTREETIAWVRTLEPPVVVGLDFSFGFPAWFATEHGCRDLADAWELASGEALARLEKCAPPFWRAKGTRGDEPALRATEIAARRQGLRPESIWKLVGPSQVGAGSVRGMPHLAGLAHEWSVWPLDDATDRLIVEVYPRACRGIRGRDGLPHPAPANDDAYDATIAALTMWEHRDRLVSLEASLDPVTRLEGAIWLP
jgi:hypothetical protein